MRESTRETSKMKTHATASVDILYKKRKQGLRRCEAKNMKTREEAEAIQHQGWAVLRNRGKGYCGSNGIGYEACVRWRLSTKVRKKEGKGSEITWGWLRDQNFYGTLALAFYYESPSRFQLYSLWCHSAPRHVPTVRLQPLPVQTTSDTPLFHNPTDIIGFKIIEFDHFIKKRNHIQNPSTFPKLTHRFMYPFCL